MKIIIWGTGSFAKKMMQDWENEIQYKYEIVGFVDGTFKKNETSSFGQYKVFDPTQLLGLEFDLIVIFSSFEKKIKNVIQEITGRLPVIEIQDFLAELFKDTSSEIVPKKIVLLGAGKRTQSYLYYLAARFEILGILESEVEFVDQFGQRVKNLSWGDLASVNFDAIFVTDEEIDYDEKINQYTHMDKVYMKKDWQKYAYCSVEKKLGLKNPDNRYYVIADGLPGTSGLMAIMYRVLYNVDFARKKGWIPVVDLKYKKNYLLEDNEVGVINAWEYYFENLCPITIDEVYQSQNVIFAGNDINRLSYNDLDIFCGFRQVYDSTFKLKKNIIQQINEVEKRCFTDIREKEIIGVICRGTDYVERQPVNHPKQPSIDEVIEKIDECLSKEKEKQYIYLATEDMSIIKQMKGRYGERVIYVEQQRFSHTENNVLADIPAMRENDRFLRGLEYIESIVLFRNCKSIIAGKCGAVFGLFVLSDIASEELFLFEKGTY